MNRNCSWKVWQRLIWEIQINNWLTFRKGILIEFSSATFLTFMKLNFKNGARYKRLSQISIQFAPKNVSSISYLPLIFSCRIFLRFILFKKKINEASILLVSILSFISKSIFVTEWTSHSCISRSVDMIC